ncbi:DDE-type integrase/transposase/recombinase [Celeribacter sp.]|uniref:DDE-type integrase/transposase/recombinase n=1 Tax=Celeribacter sp. TaxID=1890673 RepID=UPI003A918161
MIEPDPPQLSVVQQSKLLSISRTSFYYTAKGEAAQNFNLMPIYQKPNTSKRAKGQKTYLYLLRGLRVDRPNQAWCSDITYLPMRRGFLYLVAIMDWHSRKVLSWWISNTLEANFCPSRQICVANRLPGKGRGAERGQPQVWPARDNEY